MTATDRTFVIGALRFVCWVRDDGTYTWRTDCGRFAAQREGHHYKARAGSEVLGNRYPSLAAAMGACVAAAVGRRRAA